MAVLRATLPKSDLFLALLLGPSSAMIYQFSAFEIDEEKRELRLNGREIALQPRVFDLLLYLVRNRDRVVGKEELLDALWADVIVGDAALQRGISLARSALQQGGADSAIRTYARHGYRFCAEIRCDDTPPQPGKTSASLEQARLAYGGREWEAAIRGFAAADREEALRAADLERWAYAIQCAGRDADALGPLERAVAAHAAAGDRRGAARAALLLAQIQFERREPAVAKGWHSRAASFLAREQETREHGLLEWLASRFAAADGKLEEALQHAEQALALGRRLADPDLEALGLLFGGLALLALGDVPSGNARQDEAAATALAGEVSPWVGGTVYCGILWGCRNRLDWERAAQWTVEFTRWCERSQLLSFPGLCRLHRAEVLGVCGEIAEAEQEIKEACEHLSVSAPWAAGDAHRVLGELRLACADLAGAETAFRRAYELGWDPQPGYALLSMARGNADAAVRGLERSLEDPGWANRQRRGLLLAHLAIAAAAAGQHDRARSALEELDQQPALWATPALAAMVSRARAEVALCEGRRAEAMASLRRALQIWQEISAPLSAAGVRLRLAQLLLMDRDTEAAELELSAAESAFRKAGASAALQSCEEMRRSLV
jgi:DNA-binding winged helix-turn-helix (wHTH) protein